ncbi:PHD finger protein 7-like [Grus japonensis]|uniref:PHD finger protein 7-like n=1 Tax=Grus japonensis TaxID=30415 RepID=A0ABC9YES4_GRUJA
MQRGADEEGFYGFLFPDIRQELKRVAQKRCCICRLQGASVTCKSRRCRRTFHFPCGSERGCISQFFGEFKSFCWKHRPVQRVRAVQHGQTPCLICLEAVAGRPTYDTLVCPACASAWFHRRCIQGQALRSALHYFRCPLCRDMATFQAEMFRLGIKIPDRDAAWEEEDGAFAEHYERHGSCDAGLCLCPAGREQAEVNGPWRLLLCSSCGSRGTHQLCSAVGEDANSWECADCRGTGTVCGLCRRGDCDPEIFGQLCRQNRLLIHENCLYHASRLMQRGADEEGFYGFLFPDIRQELKRVAQKRCCICRLQGASVTCKSRRCRRTFHFPCGSERGCISQFFGEFKSFCWKHRPVQRVRAVQHGQTPCLICLEAVAGRPTYDTLVCPACASAWFHRRCIQGQALRSALHYFCCPLCRDMATFQAEMFRLGIKIPDRDAAWEEEDGAFAEHYERHGSCDAGLCLCPAGREQAEVNGPWRLLLCSSCGSRGTHQLCSAVGEDANSWECADCRGTGTALDMATLQAEMFRLGIKIPDRDAAWEEEDGAFAEHYERHSSCDAGLCLCPAGREQAEVNGPWRLLLCSSCGSRGTHQLCSAVGEDASSWECADCRGTGTVTSVEPGSDPNPPGQRGFWPVPSCASRGPCTVGTSSGLSPIPLPALPQTATPERC